MHITNVGLSFVGGKENANIQHWLLLIMLVRFCRSEKLIHVRYSPLLGSISDMHNGKVSGTEIS